MEVPSPNHWATLKGGICNMVTRGLYLKWTQNYSLNGSLTSSSLHGNFNSTYNPFSSLFNNWNFCNANTRIERPMSQQIFCQKRAIKLMKFSTFTPLTSYLELLEEATC
ncbi:hypothetical protein KY290_026148 [Solanum tuberosum]|uniref:Uncharacterized protein n=1 Tax=Solanum tuberosum TaxID=4113 RepID=A0ABQ7UWN6_SOLTU|nr:hypothetical protein KY289_025242 [Solanum tuberosum]KAH0677218.1 hypothetical protein KY285_025019 [Solanum tuberosum]KAH0755878.1 hypothetical protein KY290_026148 [Solanum tuberosum]